MRTTSSRLTRVDARMASLGCDGGAMAAATVDSLRGVERISYAVAVAQALTTLLWLRFYLLTSPGLNALDPGERLYLLFPTVFLALALTGLVVLRRGRPLVGRPSSVLLSLTTVSLVVPLTWYLALEVLFYALKNF